MSQFVHVVFIGVITLALSRQFSFLPQASAAAILLVGSIRMVPSKYLYNLWKIDKARLALCLGTTLVSVIQDPVVGIMAGMVVAFFANAKKIVEGKETCDIKQISSTKPVAFKVTLNGPLSYITGEQVEKYTKMLKGTAKVVVLSLGCVNEVDTDGIIFLERAVKGLQDDGCAVLLSKVRKAIAPQLRVVAGLAALEKAVLATEAEDILLTCDLGDEANTYWSQKIPEGKVDRRTSKESTASTAASSDMPSYDFSDDSSQGTYKESTNSTAASCGVKTNVPEAADVTIFL
jgi:MFS superfamily sulfate permease-like transporter